MIMQSIHLSGATRISGHSHDPSVVGTRPFAVVRVEEGLSGVGIHVNPENLDQARLLGEILLQQVEHITQQANDPPQELEAA